MPIPLTQAERKEREAMKEANNEAAAKVEELTAKVKQLEASSDYYWKKALKYEAAFKATTAALNALTED